MSHSSQNGICNAPEPLRAHGIKRCAGGFSLMEILVSLIILSIGLLGVAALQAGSTRYNHSGQLRSIATYQAYNMLDRIRANKAGAEAGAYDNLSGNPGTPGCTSCTPSQIAQKDLSEWNSANANQLPSGQGTVVKNGNVYSITIHWDNDRNGAAGLGCSSDTSTDLTCIQVSGEL